jgi:predicted RNA polymerase sigma factor
VREGVGELEAALRRRRAGPYQLQAAIAALHVQAPSPDEVDWEHVALLYGALAQLSPSPVVELNRGVAVGFASGPQAGLPPLEPPAERLNDYQPLFAARAELLRRAGDADGARGLRPRHRAQRERGRARRTGAPTRCAYLRRKDSILPSRLQSDVLSEQSTR